MPGTVFHSYNRIEVLSQSYRTLPEKEAPVEYVDAALSMDDVEWNAYNEIWPGAQFGAQQVADWAYIKDKNDLNIPGTDYNESWTAANVAGEEYTVIAFGSNNQWENWSSLYDGSACASPVYIFYATL